MLRALILSGMTIVGLYFIGVSPEKIGQRIDHASHEASVRAQPDHYR